MKSRQRFWRNATGLQCHCQIRVVHSVVNSQSVSVLLPSTRVTSESTVVSNTDVLGLVDP